MKQISRDTYEEKGITVPGTWTYRIAVWHGEHGSHFYIVRSHSNDPDDWEIEMSFDTREQVERYLTGTLGELADNG